MPLGNWEKERLKTFFHYCPICHSEEKSVIESLPFHTSTVTCRACGAKWELHYSLGKLLGAKLVKADLQGNGTYLLDVEHPPEFWQNMGIKGRIPPSP